jgi:hypothetical protein
MRATSIVALLLRDAPATCVTLGFGAAVLYTALGRLTFRGTVLSFTLRLGTALRVAPLFGSLCISAALGGTTLVSAMLGSTALFHAPLCSALFGMVPIVASIVRRVARGLVHVRRAAPHAVIVQLTRLVAEVHPAPVVLVIPTPIHQIRGLATVDSVWIVFHARWGRLDVLDRFAIDDFASRVRKATR